MGRVVFNISRDPNIPRVRVSSENRQTVCFCATVIIVYLSMASRSVVACLLLAMYKCGHGFGQPCSTFDMADCELRRMSGAPPRSRPATEL